MKKLLLFAVLPALTLQPAYSEEPPKVKIAVVNLNAMMNSGNFHQKIALLSAGEDTLAALKKIASELKAVQQEIVDADNQEKLNQLQNKQNFLNQKLNIIMQKAYNHDGRRDVQALLKEFVIGAFKDKYPLILQQDGGDYNRMILWKGDSRITDITEEAAAKLQERLDKLSGGVVGAMMPGMMGGMKPSSYNRPPIKPSAPSGKQPPAAKPVPVAPKKVTSI
jgi:hypothetical protein